MSGMERTGFMRMPQRIDLHDDVACKLPLRQSRWLAATFTNQGQSSLIKPNQVISFASPK